MDLENPEKKTIFTFTLKTSDNSRKASTTLYYFAQLALRVVVIALTLSGIYALVNSAQSVTIFGVVMAAKYTDSSSLRFKLIADSLVCGLTVLSVIHVVSLNLPASNPKNYFYLLLHDLVSLVVLLSACSAGMAIGFVGKFGQPQSGWVPICDRVGRFCHEITLSIASSFLAVILLLLLTLMSAHKLKSETNFEGV